jgi:hypothetical protein
MILLADFFLLKQYITLGALSFDAKTVVKTVFYQRKCGRSLSRSRPIDCEERQIK